MKNKILNIISSCLVILILSHYGMCSDNFQELIEFEGFLKKNKSNMTMTSRGHYALDEDGFDKIFPTCTVLGIDTSKPNYSIGFIENTYKEDLLSSSTITEAGTGTIIDNNVDLITVLTASHVVNKKGNITFTLGSARINSGEKTLNHIAKYEASEVFVHDSEDIAFVNFRLVSTVLQSKDALKSFSMGRDHTPISSRKKVTMFHYPFAVEDQRINNGFILKDADLHTIPSLGGSSGSPLILGDNIVGIHSGAREKTNVKVNYQGETLNIYKHNSFVRLSNISEGLTDFKKIF